MWASAMRQVVGRVLGADQMLAPPLLKLTLVAEGDDRVKAFTHARHEGT